MPGLLLEPVPACRGSGLPITLYGESMSIRTTLIKNMSRQSKIELIRKNNPLMRDLYEDITGRIPD